jgi:hypothetical protein
MILNQRNNNGQDSKQKAEETSHTQTQEDSKEEVTQTLSPYWLTLRGGLVLFRGNHETRYTIMLWHIFNVENNPAITEVVRI